MHKLSRKDTKVSAIADTLSHCSKDGRGRATKFFDSSRNIKELLYSVQPGTRPNEEKPSPQTGLARLVVVVGDGCP